MFPAGRPDGDFNVLTQGDEELHKASDGKVARAVPHQQGDLRLLHTENSGNLGLLHAAALKNGMDLQGELRLEQFLFRIGKTKVCKNVSTSCGYANNSVACLFGFGFHFSSAFPYRPARHPLAVA